jgi:hypothetical protein
MSMLQAGQRLGQATNQRNSLLRKFSEIKDFPLQHKLGTYGKGSILADEDVVYLREHYSCTVRCISNTGSLYQIDANDLRVIKQN